MVQKTAPPQSFRSNLKSLGASPLASLGKLGMLATAKTAVGAGPR